MWDRFSETKTIVFLVAVLLIGVLAGMVAWALR